MQPYDGKEVRKIFSTNCICSAEWNTKTNIDVATSLSMIGKVAGITTYPMRLEGIEFA
jgi:hypothetical protein